MEKDSKIIVFSGGCFSGKTTTMKALQTELINKGYKVYILKEIIRDIINEPIDQLRNNPIKYFEVQKKIITEKIKQEKQAFELAKKQKNTIFLVDRAITDSLFYYENYVDKTNLPDKIIEEYCEFQEQIDKYAYEAFEYIYNAIVEFTPLNVTSNVDKFRPKNISKLKYYEYNVISRLNDYYYTKAKYKPIYLCGNLNKQTLDNIAKSMVNALYL